MNADDHIAARAELLATCRANHIRRILVDATEVVQKPSSTHLFDFASAWPAILRENPVVVAGVLPADPEARRWWRFGEDVALNRGLITHAFESAEEAREWLTRW